MTLDELIEECQDIREKTGHDMAVRLVIKEEDGLGWQYDCIGAQDFHGIPESSKNENVYSVLLLLGGERAANMDWP